MKRLVIVFLVLLFSGCAHDPNHFYWGHYEKVLYKSQVTPEKVETAELIAQLQQDIQTAQDKQKPIAPGVEAELGHLYAAQGQDELAKQHLLSEAKAFPAARSFVDTIITSQQGDAS